MGELYEICKEHENPSNGNKKEMKLIFRTIKHLHCDNIFKTFKHGGDTSSGGDKETLLTKIYFENVNYESGLCLIFNH